MDGEDFLRIFGRENQKKSYHKTKKTVAMETALKRENIDLPADVLKKLSAMALSQGKTLKAYIENLLIDKAESMSLETGGNPSPSGDEWFDDPMNIQSVRKGMAEIEEGKGKVYTLEEIKETLGI